MICVFVATHPEGGRRIVGWYRNAKVFSQYQHYSGKDRENLTSQDDWDDYSDQVGYYACAKSNDVVLLTLDERLDAPQVPNGKGGFGQSNVWYADTDIGIDFRRKTYEYILRYEKNATTENNAEHRREERGKTDVTLKKKVEETAIKRTREYSSPSVHSTNILPIHLRPTKCQGHPFCLQDPYLLPHRPLSLFYLTSEVYTIFWTLPKNQGKPLVMVPLIFIWLCFSSLK